MSKTNPTAKELIYQTKEKVDVLEFQEKKLQKELAQMKAPLDIAVNNSKFARITLEGSDFEIHSVAKDNLLRFEDEVKRLRQSIELKQKEIDRCSKELGVQKSLLEIRIESYRAV